jgi:hypothetical protein
MFRALVLLMTLSTTSNVFAQSEHEDPGAKVQFTQYYTIEDSTTIQPPTGPQLLDLISLQPAATIAEDLMSWAENNTKWMMPTVPYNRAKHFGSWLSDPLDRPCLNTREKVLIRDSDRTVDLGPDGCTVKGGEWVDPYGGATHLRPVEVQIDHMVPLKNAYLMGASKWDAKARCVYANFLANDFHLLAVEGRLNQSKGDSDPSHWMPPNKQFHCTYLKDWLSVKMIWGLIMSPDEAQAISKLFKEEGCDPRSFQMTKSEITKQRRAISDKFEMCN